MADLRFQNSMGECTIDSTYIFHQKDVYQTGANESIAMVGFSIKQVNPSGLRCFLAIETRDYPYIVLQPAGNSLIQIMQKGTQSFFEIIVGERPQIQILVNTEHPDIASYTNYDENITIVLPVYCSLENQDDWDVVMMENIPFLIIYSLKICPISPYQGVVGIDFGTTSTCVSYLPNGSQNLTPELIKMGRLTEIPTWIYFESIQKIHDEKVSKIRRMSRFKEQTNLNPKLLIRGIKRYLGSNINYNIHKIPYGSMCYIFETEELVALYLQELQKDFVKETKTFFGYVGNTSPCNFGIAERNALIKSYEQLKPPVHQGRLELDIDEPTAAAIFYTIKEIEKQGGTLEDYVKRYGDGQIQRNLLIYDFGGGTIDIALVSIYANANKNEEKIRFQLLGNTSIMDFGGDNVTLALLKRIKAYFCNLLLQGNEVQIAHDNRNRGLASYEPWYEEFMNLHSMKHKLEQYLKNDTNLTVYDKNRLDSIIKSLIVTNFADFPEGSYERKDALELFGSFWEACDQAKKNLCNQGDKLENFLMFMNPLEIWYKQLGIEENDSLIERMREHSITLEKDLYPFIETPLKQSVRAMKLVCMKEFDQGFHTINEIQLVGNSSKIPLVKKLIEEEMTTPWTIGNNQVQCIPGVQDILKEVDEDAKTSVSKGMSIALAIMQGTCTIQMNIDKQRDLLPYEIGFKPPVGTWQTVFPKGRQVQKFEYRPVNPSSIQRLEMFRRICNWHKVPGGLQKNAIDPYEPPLYSLGKFIFEPQYALPNVNNIQPIDHIAFFYTPGGEFIAQKMNRFYPFQWNKEVSPESDPFSGVH